MSCNGCRVLRKGCSDSCLLRPCIQWIDTAEAQGHATVFVAKFFGRAGLMSFISNVPPSQRPSLFQSLLFEACGRTINPVTGAVGLLGTGSWQLCQAAVDTVLRGETLRPLPELVIGLEDNKFEMPSFSTAKRQCKPSHKIEVELSCDLDLCLTPRFPGVKREEKRTRSSTPSEGSIMTSGKSGTGHFGEPKLLSLFV